MSAPRALVVGAGIGGLAAALSLTCRGFAVHVLEAGSQPGGKAGAVTLDGVEVDTGPSVLTLPDVFAQLFERAGLPLDAAVRLRPLDPGFRYHWPDGAKLDVAHHPEQTLAAVRSTFGAAAEADLAAFLAYSKAIWQAAAPHFVLGPAPTWAAMIGLALRHPAALRAVDPLRSMGAGIDRWVREPHLRMLLRRYATYNGSDPRRAPATLNCIAHVELALGGYGIEGGIYALVRALVQAIEARGGVIETDAAVQRLQVEGGRVVGLHLADGRSMRGEVVVVNADVGALRATLLPQAATVLPRAAPPSMSGWTGVLAAAPAPRLPHEVVFPADYDAEFHDIFDKDQPPADPTIYLCAQSRCHGRPGWPAAEPVFLMANAPAEPEHGPRDPAVWEKLEAQVERRAKAAGLWGPADRLLWRRSPSALAAQLPGSRGSIYGAASNDRFAAFKRPANRIDGLPGLYLASGSAHPGGGLPMVALSGMAAADCAAADLQPHTTVMVAPRAP